MSPGTATLSLSWFVMRRLQGPSPALFSQTEEATEAFGGGPAWPLPALVTVGCHATLLSLLLPAQNGKAEPASLPPRVAARFREVRARVVGPPGMSVSSSPTP